MFKAGTTDTYGNCCFKNPLTVWPPIPLVPDYAEANNFEKLEKQNNKTWKVKQKLWFIKQIGRRGKCSSEAQNIFGGIFYNSF